MQFAANLDRLWPGRPVMERFQRAAAHGFAFVEFLYPVDHEPRVIDEALTETGLELALSNIGVADSHARQRGLLTVPGREHDFDVCARQHLELARRWRLTRLHALGGFPPDPSDRDRCMATAVANLRAVADRSGDAGVAVLVEFINLHDLPGHGIATFDDAVAIVEAVAHPAVRLQFDQYHVGMAGRDPVAEFLANQHLVGHVQVAEFPGRLEPAPGSEQVPRFLSAIEASGYDGMVGLEYDPLVGSEPNFGWLTEYRPDARRRHAG